MNRARLSLALAIIVAVAIIAEGTFLESRLALDSHFIRIYWKQIYQAPSDR